MKRNIIIAALTLILILAAPITLVSVGFGAPPQFGATYYGELSDMFGRLNRTEGKKIVLIGNSAVAFGVRSDLLQAEFPDYTVVNFGLYGALGTKLMLDLSRSNISAGDIIVVMPELIRQSLSLYFSAAETWRAVDGDFSMLRYIAADNVPAMVGNFAGYVGEKFGFMRSGEEAPGIGAYSRGAFKNDRGEDVGYMTYDRPYNVMTGGYDPTVTTLMDASVFGEGFLDYLNEYNKFASARGATVYYGFVPVNELTSADGGAEDADELYTYLRTHLDFEVIGHPEKYFLDYRWFYDNNVHMNSAGMYVFTDLLAEDLKLALGINVPNRIVIPEMPEAPVGGAVSGDNSDAALFTYTRLSDVSGEYVRLTGLTAEGKTRTEITVPADYDGIPVREFDASVFRDNKVVSRIILPKTIGSLYDDSFAGATRLSALIFNHDAVLGISAGADFLRGADNCYIYLKKGVNVAGCAGGWERYKDRIKYY